jgi:acetyltransferase
MTISSTLKTSPYPKKWEKEKILPNGKTILLRPVKPEDEESLISFVEKCDPEDIRQRLFESVRSLSHSTAALLTHVDYNRTMSFVALDKKTGELLGITHLVRDVDDSRAEYAVITRSDVKQQGIGLILTRLLIDYAMAKNINELWGQVMRDNTAMLNICQKLGVHLTTDKDDPIYMMATLSLDSAKNLGKELSNT